MSTEPGPLLSVRLYGGGTINIPHLTMDRALDIAADLSTTPPAGSDRFYPITTEAPTPNGGTLKRYRVIRRAHVSAVEVIER